MCSFFISHYTTLGNPKSPRNLKLDYYELQGAFEQLFSQIHYIIWWSMNWSGWILLNARAFKCTAYLLHSTTRITLAHRKFLLKFIFLGVQCETLINCNKNGLNFFGFSDNLRHLRSFSDILLKLLNVTFIFIRH